MIVTSFYAIVAGIDMAKEPKPRLYVAELYSLLVTMLVHECLVMYELLARIIGGLF